MDWSSVTRVSIAGSSYSLGVSGLFYQRRSRGPLLAAHDDVRATSPAWWARSGSNRHAALAAPAPKAGASAISPLAHGSALGGRQSSPCGPRSGRTGQAACRSSSHAPICSRICGWSREEHARRRPALGAVAAVRPLEVVEAQEGLQVGVDRRRAGVVAVAEGDPVVEMEDGALEALHEGVEVRAPGRDPVVADAVTPAGLAERPAELGPVVGRGRHGVGARPGGRPARHPRRGSGP